MKYTIPKAFYKVFEDIGNEVYEVSAELMDRELYEDLIKDMDSDFIGRITNQIKSLIRIIYIIQM